MYELRWDLISKDNVKVNCPWLWLLSSSLFCAVKLFTMLAFQVENYQQFWNPISWSEWLKTGIAATQVHILLSLCSPCWLQNCKLAEGWNKPESCSLDTERTEFLSILIPFWLLRTELAVEAQRQHSVHVHSGAAHSHTSAGLGSDSLPAYQVSVFSSSSSSGALIMRQEVECCAEVITQSDGEKHFLLSNIMIFNRVVQSFVLGM